jgi:hypothetical protein
MILSNETDIHRNNDRKLPNRVMKLEGHNCQHTRIWQQIPKRRIDAKAILKNLSVEEGMQIGERDEHLSNAGLPIDDSLDVDPKRPTSSGGRTPVRNLAFA